MAGRRTAYLLLVPVVLFYTLLPSIWSRTEPYLNRRFKGQIFAARFAAHFKHNLEFGKMLVDRAVLGILGQFTLQAGPAEKQAVQDQLAKGKGLIILSAHVGCWQSGISGLDFIRRPVNILLHRPPGDKDRHYFEHRGAETPFRFIESSDAIGGVLESMAALKRGEVVCIMGDRVFGSGKSNVQVSLLGGRVDVPVSPYKMASATGASVLTVFFRRTGPGLGEVRMVDVMPPPPREQSSPEHLTRCAQSFANKLEKYIEECPYQFFNFHNLWKVD